jgi:hypothetical protein
MRYITITLDVGIKEDTNDESLGEKIGDFFCSDPDHLFDEIEVVDGWSITPQEDT